MSAYPGNIEVGDVFDDGRHHKAVPVGPDREPVPASHVRQTFRPGRDIDDLSPR